MNQYANAKKDSLLTSANNTEVYSSEEELIKHLEEKVNLDLNQLEKLKDEYNKIGNPEELTKVIENEIWEQFKNQLCLDATNESLIQEYKRKNPKGYTKEKGDAVMQDPTYRKANAEMKAAYQRGELVDAYTGKKITQDTKPNLDHVIARKEIENDLVFMMSGESLADVANTRENLAATNESLNKSKGAKSIPDYVKERNKREASLKEQNKRNHEKIEKSNKTPEEKRKAHEKADKRLDDKLAANDARMMEHYKLAKKAIKRKTISGAAKNTLKKAGRDALKAMTISALYDLLRSIIDGLRRYFKEKQRSFKCLMEEMKASIMQYLNKMKNFLQIGTQTFTSTIISQVLDPILYVFKKFSSLIKQGFSSLMSAIRYLRDPQNKDKPLSIKIAQIGKILISGFAAGISILLGEGIEMALTAIPMMTIAIPGLGTLASVTGLFLAGVISGVIGAISMNLIDRWIAGKMRDEKNSERMEQQKIIIHDQNILIDMKKKKLSKKEAETREDIKLIFKNGAIEVKKSIENIREPIPYIPGNTPNTAQLNKQDEDHMQNKQELDELETRNRGGVQ